MSITLVDVKFDNVTDTSSQTTTCPKPTGLAVGDVMVAFVRSRTPITSAPSGWTLAITPDTSTNGCTYAYWKVATSGDVLTLGYTWTQTTASGRLASVIAAYRGVDTTSPEDTTTLIYTGTNGGTVIRNDGITTVSANSVLVAGWFWNGDGNTNTGTLNGSFTSRVDSQFTGGGRQNLLVGDMTKTSVGATGAINSTVTATTILLRSSVVFALRPAATAQHGSATGEMDIAGAAAGHGIDHAAGSGGLNVAGSAVGHATDRAGASGGLDIAGATEATIVARALGAGGVDLAGAAAGHATTHGATTGGLAITGTAAGHSGPSTPARDITADAALAASPTTTLQQSRWSTALEEDTYR